MHVNTLCSRTFVYIFSLVLIVANLIHMPRHLACKMPVKTPSFANTTECKAKKNARYCSIFEAVYHL